MSRLRGVLRLSGRERVLLLQAMAMLVVARLSLALVGFTRTHALFQRIPRVAPQAVNAPLEQEIAHLTMKMVGVAAAHGACRATCLPRSLVAWALLRRQGLDPELRLGARRKNGMLEAHAWVAVGATAFGDAGDDGAPFAPFAIGTPRA